MSDLAVKGGENDLPVIAAQIRAKISGHFCLWLDGSMGAGKTTFTRFFLQSFGLDPRVPVTSPTFTYVNEYLIDGQAFAHWDLYRIEGDFSPEDLGHISERDFYGTIVEWPERLQNPDELKPTHKLEIDNSESDDNRIYRLFKL